ncbi:hypothetical protein POM88_022130 [Heracleum sosnowskyi]|uniref:Uncharacterized protein n=1 Tax=Heracleum sosnowskyi TaxID=360622 RepID=A0AAD8IER0_9APIA|nr:hypothetical protein POM88_022130 [Heracleum sosnowskyi]
MKGEKCLIQKSLDMRKQQKVYDDWGWGIGQKPKLQGGFDVCRHHISESAMQSLAPGSWVDDRIIYSYMGLLREREEDIHNGNIWERKPVYYCNTPRSGVRNLGCHASSII